MGSHETYLLAYGLIFLGFVLLFAELLLPSGVLALVALASIAVGVALTFRDTTTGIITLVSVCVALPTLGGVLLHYWPRTRIGKRFFLTETDVDDTQATPQGAKAMETLRGRVGRATSNLRPSGTVEFDGQTVDSITEGMPVESGHWVRCVAVRGGRVIVRPIDNPDLGALEDADFD